MRLELVVGAVVLLALGFVMGRYQARRGVDRGAHALAKDKVVVDVQVARDGQQLRIDVRPGLAEIRRGGEVEWQHNGDSLAVTAKKDWPFTQREVRAGKGQRAASGRARQDAPRNTPFPYAITIHKDGEEFVIDPEVVIRW
jgi:hypothetical protein